MSNGGDVPSVAGFLKSIETVRDDTRRGPASLADTEHWTLDLDESALTHLAKDR